MEIFVDNVMRVIDVHQSRVSDETYNYLRNNHQDYTDQVSNEHLFAIETAIEELADNEATEQVVKEVTALHEAARKHEAGYVRFIQ